MEKIKVSVLIYVLNDRMHIEKCVRSVMEQSLQELEILLIDGGSTDGTLEKLEDLRDEDARIRIIRCGSGVGVQFNTGLKEASGKYIGICESDDYLLKDMYERQYAVAEKYELDVLRANIMRFCENNDRLYSVRFAVASDTTLYDTILYPQKDDRFLNLGVNCFWSGLYRREFLINNDIYMNETKGASYQDTGFSFLTQMYAERAYVMSEAFYCYRMDNPSSSINNPMKASLLNTEYQLLKKELKQRNLWYKYMEIYWKWRVNGFLWAYDNVSDEKKAEYLPILYKDMRDEMETESYSETALSVKERQVCDIVRASSKKFKAFFEAMDATRRQQEKRINSIGADDDIIIFGTGNLGLLVNCCFGQKECQVVGCIDNDLRKWEKEFDGLKILSPEEGIKRYPNAIYIIANVVHSREMKEQLQYLGVKEERIVVCDNYDLFVANILVPKMKKDENNDYCYSTNL